MESKYEYANRNIFFMYENFELKTLLLFKSITYNVFPDRKLNLYNQDELTIFKCLTFVDLWHRLKFQNLKNLNFEYCLLHFIKSSFLSLLLLILFHQRKTCLAHLK